MNLNLSKSVFIDLELGDKPLSLDFITLSDIAIVFVILILIGAYLLYMAGKAMIGGIIVLIFSIISIITRGRSPSEYILSSVGSVLGLMKK